MPDWMPHFATFSTQDWFSLWTLVLAALALAANVLTACWTSSKMDAKLSEMEQSMAVGLEQLDDKIRNLDSDYAYVIGVLDGAGLTRARKSRNG